MTPTPPHDAFPMVCQNGRFLPAREAAVSIFDRGLLYGDGLFETLRISASRPLRWNQHLERLTAGAAFLQIALPQPPDALHAAAIRLIELNRAPTALLRLTLTRGIGPRGYSTAEATAPTLVLTLHQAPAIEPQAPTQWRLVTSRIRIGPDDPLTRFKTCNRLPYVLARQDAQTARVDDALILNTRGELAETSSANLFWLRGGVLATTPIDSGALPGVTRADVLRLALDLGLSAQEPAATPDALFNADAVFLTLTSLGIIEVVELDRRPLARSGLVQSLHAAYWQNVKVREVIGSTHQPEECGGGSGIGPPGPKAGRRPPQNRTSAIHASGSS